MRARRDPEFMAVLRRADLCLADGVGVLWAGRVLGRPFARASPAWTPPSARLAALAARRGDRVYLLGAAPGVAERAAAILQAECPGLIVAGTLRRLAGPRRGGRHRRARPRGPPAHPVGGLRRAGAGQVAGPQPGPLRRPVGHRRRRRVRFHQRRVAARAGLGPAAGPGVAAPPDLRALALAPHDRPARSLPWRHMGQTRVANDTGRRRTTIPTSTE